MGTWLVLVGTGLRCLIPRGYEKDLFFLVHIGQILNAAVGPIVMATPPKLSVDWFPVSQRTTATAFSAVSNSFGVAFGFVLVPALVTKFDSMGYAGVQFMLFTEFWMTLVIAIMIFAYFPAYPPTPPSRSAQTPRLPFKESLLAASSNKSFWMLCICGGVSQGIFRCVLLCRIHCCSSSFLGMKCHTAKKTRAGRERERGGGKGRGQPWKTSARNE